MLCIGVVADDAHLPMTGRARIDLAAVSSLDGIKTTLAPMSRLEMVQAKPISNCANAKRSLKSHYGVRPVLSCDGTVLVRLTRSGDAGDLCIVIGRAMVGLATDWHYGACGDNIGTFGGTTFLADPLLLSITEW